MIGKLFYGLPQGSANYFCKRPDGKYLRFESRIVSDATIQIHYCSIKTIGLA